MHDHELEMESDAERRRRLTRVQVQRHCRAEDDSQSQQQEADQCGHNLIRPYIVVVAASDGVAALVSWLIYKCSDTIEQRMISRASNDEGLTDDTVTYAN